MIFNLINQVESENVFFGPLSQGLYMSTRFINGGALEI